MPRRQSDLISLDDLLVALDGGPHAREGDDGSLELFVSGRPSADRRERRQGEKRKSQGRPSQDEDPSHLESALISAFANQAPDIILEGSAAPKRPSRHPEREAARNAWREEQKLRSSFWQKELAESRDRKLSNAEDGDIQSQDTQPLGRRHGIEPSADLSSDADARSKGKDSQESRFSSEDSSSMDLDEEELLKKGKKKVRKYEEAILRAQAAKGAIGKARSSEETSSDEASKGEESAEPEYGNAPDDHGQPQSAYANLVREARTAPVDMVAKEAAKREDALHDDATQKRLSEEAERIRQLEGRRAYQAQLQNERALRLQQEIAAAKAEFQSNVARSSAFGEAQDAKRPSSASSMQSPYSQPGTVQNGSRIGWPANAQAQSVNGPYASQQAQQVARSAYRAQAQAPVAGESQMDYWNRMRAQSGQPIQPLRSTQGAQASSSASVSNQGIQDAAKQARFATPGVGQLGQARTASRGEAASRQYQQQAASSVGLRKMGKLKHDPNVRFVPIVSLLVRSDAEKAEALESSESRVEMPMERAAQAESANAPASSPSTMEAVAEEPGKKVAGSAGTTQGASSASGASAMRAQGAYGTPQASQGISQPPLRPQASAQAMRPQQYVQPRPSVARPAQAPAIYGATQSDISAYAQRPVDAQNSIVLASKAVDSKKPSKETLLGIGLIALGVILAIVALLVANGVFTAATQEERSSASSNVEYNEVNPAQASDSTAVFGYVVRASDGTEYQAVETAHFNENGILDKSTVEVATGSQEASDAILAELEADFGDAVLESEASEDKARVVLQVTRDDMDEDSYTELLSTTMKGFKRIS